MTFWDHLDDLCKTPVYPFLTLILLTVVAFIQKDPAFGIMLAANDPDFVTYGLAPGGEDHEELYPYRPSRLWATATPHLSNSA